MKKIVSIILVVVLLFAFMVTPVFADIYDPSKEYDWLFLDKFIKYEIDSGSSVLTYTEYYYHKDANGDIDWVWIISGTSPTEEYQGESAIILNDKVLGYSYIYNVFTYGHGIYDVKADKFIDITKVDFSKYDGMEEYIDKNIGSRIGDADGDKTLSVLDATLIQMANAQLCEFGDDYREGYGYLSDMDRDGERTVMDATAIQMKLAQLEYTSIKE